MTCVIFICFLPVWSSPCSTTRWIIFRGLNVWKRLGNHSNVQDLQLAPDCMPSKSGAFYPTSRGLFLRLSDLFLFCCFLRWEALSLENRSTNCCWMNNFGLNLLEMCSLMGDFYPFWLTSTGLTYIHGMNQSWQQAVSSAVQFLFGLTTTSSFTRPDQTAHTVALICKHRCWHFCVAIKC